MTTAKRTEIEFRLEDISTHQFALIGDPPPTDGNPEVREGIRFAFGTSEEDTLIGCLFGYSLHEMERLFLTIEVSCAFRIKEKHWTQLLDKDSNSIIVPKKFAQQLADITIGTTRGILHSKTENTPFNKYPVGLINTANTFIEDPIIKLS